MIVVTGASSGLGAALVSLYDSNQQTTFFTGRSAEKLECLNSTLTHSLGYHRCDMAVHSEVAALFEQLPSTPKTIIHCAGSGYFGLLELQSPQAIQTLIANNLNSAINLVQEAVKRYQNEPVTVVMVMSTAALQAKAQESTYCAVKWAVKGLIESVRLELKDKPMKLVAVYPGGMSTEFWPSSGKAINTESFMSAKDAASMIYNAMSAIGNGYVSDITVNRC
ncbi:short-chain dehydrogenase [Vibrio galatheae]|uniref:Short-chain dehydrogenase n=1 Tax=Vibrio galatheae TaxID=579748 RepID=A0A0F4NFM4_9VIBR|nr:SDR family NAD(P)-dependent oxidoreductase [Vibrio galatheae]KJY81739.1 short-chain dehydrogenase [Vibrio galatheae]